MLTKRQRRIASGMFQQRMSLEREVMDFVKGDIDDAVRGLDQFLADQETLAHQRIPPKVRAKTNNRQRAMLLAEVAKARAGIR